MRQNALAQDLPTFRCGNAGVHEIARRVHEIARLLKLLALPPGFASLYPLKRFQVALAILQ
jgi:hypothetical protein